MSASACTSVSVSLCRLARPSSHRRPLTFHELGRVARTRLQVSSKRLKGLVTERAGEGVDGSVEQGGKLMHKDEETLASVAIPFSGSDVTDPRYLILRGSSVEYSVGVDRLSGDKRARQVAPLPLEAVVESLEASGAVSMRVGG